MTTKPEGGGKGLSGPTTKKHFFLFAASPTKHQGYRLRQNIRDRQ